MEKSGNIVRVGYVVINMYPETKGGTSAIIRTKERKTTLSSRAEVSEINTQFYVCSALSSAREWPIDRDDIS